MIVLIPLISPPYFSGENVVIVPKWQEITLVVSDWHEDITEGLIPNLDMTIHPFVEVIVMLTPEANMYKKKENLMKRLFYPSTSVTTAPWILLTARLQVAWIYVISMWIHGGSWLQMLTTLFPLILPFCSLTITCPCWE